MCAVRYGAASERHERLPGVLEAVALSPSGGQILKALLTGVCALILLALPAAAQSRTDAALGVELTRHLKTMKRDTQVLGFFDSHRWLLSDPRFATEAKRQLRRHTASLARSRARLARTKEELRKRRQVRRLAATAAMPPRKAICAVFGSHCGQALAVARCESGLQTTARNGQYLGLFQMGSQERRLYGHSPRAIDQVKAAHRYFVSSGRDWSPWSCKPWR